MKHQQEQPTRALTADEVADRLGMHVVTVRRHLNSGVIPAVKFGGAWRVSPATLDALLSGTLQVPATK